VEVGIEDTVLVDIVAMEEEEEKVVEDIEAREVTQVTVVTDRHGMESGKKPCICLSISYYISKAIRGDCGRSNHYLDLRRDP